MGLLYFYSTLPKAPGFYSHPSLISILVFDLFLKGFTPRFYYSIFQSVFSHNLQKWLRQENFTEERAVPGRAAQPGQGKLSGQGKLWGEEPHEAPPALPGGLQSSPGAGPSSARAQSRWDAPPRSVPPHVLGALQGTRVPAPRRSTSLPRCPRRVGAQGRAWDRGCLASSPRAAHPLPHCTTFSSSSLGITF